VDLGPTHDWAGNKAQSRPWFQKLQCIPTCICSNATFWVIWTDSTKKAMTEFFQSRSPIWYTHTPTYVTTGKIIFWFMYVSSNIPCGMNRARVCVPGQITDRKHTFLLKLGVLGRHTPQCTPWCIIFVKPGKNWPFRMIPMIFSWPK